jgi:hypothetical protein
MAKKISNSDLFSDDLFKDPIKNAEEYLKVINELLKTQKALLETSKKKIEATNPDDVTSLKELNKELEISNKRVENYIKLQKQEESAKIDLQKAIEQEAKKQKQLTQAKKELTRQANLEAQSTNKNISAYKRQSAELTKLRDRYKDLAARRIEGTKLTKQEQKEFEQLGRKINVLDGQLKQIDASTGQFQRNVGNYQKSFVNLGQSFGLIGPEVASVQQAFEATRETFKGVLSDFKNLITGNSDAVKALGGTTRAFKLLGTAGKATGLLGLFSLLAGAGAFFGTFEEGADAAQYALVRFQAGFGVVTRRLGEAFKSLKDGFSEGGFTGLVSAIFNVGDAFDGMSEEMSKADAAAKRLFDTMERFEEQGFRLEKRILALSVQESKYSQIVGDATVGFKDREIAERNLFEIQKEKLALQSRILKNERDQLVTQIAVNKLGGDTSENIAKVNKALETGVFTGQLKAGSLKDLLEKEKEYTKSLSDFAELQATIEATARERLDKEAKLKVNIIQDLTAKTLESNKKIIDNEKLTLSERLKALNESNVKSKVAFEEEIALLQARTKNRINADKLLSIESGAELSEAIIQANLGQKLTAELEQVIIQRRKQLEDLKGLSQDIFGKALEDAEALANLNEQDGGKVEIKVGFKIDDNEVKKVLTESLELQRIADQERLDKQKELEEKIRETIKETTDLVIDQINKRKEAQIDALEEEISKRNDNITKQEDLAERGLDNTLAFEKRKLAEAELEKQRLQKEAERREKRIAYFRAFAAYLEKNPDFAAGKALAQVLVAETLSNAFATGVENLQGAGTETSDSILARLSKGESVITAKGTREFAGLPTAINEGWGQEWMQENAGTTVVQDSSKLIKEVRELKDVIKNKKEVHINWDGLDSRVESLVQDGMKKTVTYIRKRPRL